MRMASCWHTSTCTLTRNPPLDSLFSTSVKKNKPYIYLISRVKYSFFSYCNDSVYSLFLFRIYHTSFSFNRIDDHKGWGDEKCSRSKVDRERDQRVTLRFRQLFAQVMTRWTIFLLFSSFVSFNHILSLSLFLSLSRLIFDERRRKFWMLDATTRSVWKKKETNKRTNDQHRFVYTVAIADERTIVYIFLSPTIKSVVAERATLCLCSYIRPVRFSSHYSQFHTNESGNRTTRVYSIKTKDKETKLKINIHSMTTTYKGKEKKRTYQGFSHYYWLQIRAKLLQSLCIMYSF